MFGGFDPTDEIVAPEEYRELSAEAGATSAWFFRPVAGLDGGSREAFELVQFTIAGRARPIRRSAKHGSQTYSAPIGKEVIAAGQPVLMSYTYRAIVRQDGILIKLDVEQPTRGLSVELSTAVGCGDGGARRVGWTFRFQVLCVEGSEVERLRAQLAGAVRELLVWAAEDQARSAAEKGSGRGVGPLGGAAGETDVAPAGGDLMRGRLGEPGCEPTADRGFYVRGRRQR